MNTPAISNSFLHGYTELLNRYQLPPDYIYSTTGISVSEACFPRRKIPLHTFVNLLEHSSSLAKDGMFCKGLSNIQTTNILIFLKYTLPAFPTIKQILSSISDNIHLFSDGISLTPTHTSGSNHLATISFSYNELKGKNHFINYCFHSLTNLIKALCPANKITGNYVSSPNGDINVFLAESSQHESASYIRTIETSKLNTIRSEIDHIRLAIEELLESEHCNINTISSLLNLKKRTVQRHLKDYGKSFTQLIDEERKKRAADLLNTSLDITDIALSLGFSGNSAFSRRFKCWNGKSPSQWRIDAQKTSSLKESDSEGLL